MSGQQQKSQDCAFNGRMTYISGIDTLKQEPVMSNGYLALLSFNFVTSSVMHSGAAAIGLAVLNHGRLLSSKFDPDFLSISL